MENRIDRFFNDKDIYYYKSSYFTFYDAKNNKYNLKSKRVCTQGEVYYEYELKKNNEIIQNITGAQKVLDYLKTLSYNSYSDYLEDKLSDGIDGIDEGGTYN